GSGPGARRGAPAPVDTSRRAQGLQAVGPGGRPPPRYTPRPRPRYTPYTSQSPPGCSRPIAAHQAPGGLSGTSARAHDHPAATGCDPGTPLPPTPSSPSAGQRVASTSWRASLPECVDACPMTLACQDEEAMKRGEKREENPGTRGYRTHRPSGSNGATAHAGVCSGYVFMSDPT